MVKVVGVFFKEYLFLFLFLFFIFLPLFLMARPIGFIYLLSTDTCGDYGGIFTPRHRYPLCYFQAVIAPCTNRPHYSWWLAPPRLILAHFFLGRSRWPYSNPGPTSRMQRRALGPLPLFMGVPIVTYFIFYFYYIDIEVIL